MNRNERLIVRTLIAAVQLAGWTLYAVNDGEASPAAQTADRAIELGCNLDGCHLMFEREGRGEYSWVYLIFGNGNDGLDVVSDYTTNLEDPVTSIDAFIEQLASEYQGEALYVSGGDFERVNAKDKLELAAASLADTLREIVKASGGQIGHMPRINYLACEALAKLD